ncbi:MAG: hypothetical protein AAB225_27705 [Acidobacteriota bacterium]
MNPCLTIATLLLAAAPPLRLSVYTTAGGVNKYLSTPEGRQKAIAVLRPLKVSRIFLEGRRGDEYVPPDLLRAVRDHFAREGFAVSGGIATVPGPTFGVRQNERLGWLNWEAAKTRRDISAFFTENAPLFDELIVDDFYCTADTTPPSEKARGTRTWARYRQDLLVSLIAPMMLEPARAARPGVRLILKYPQWYDRFHLFGYDPARMSPPFDSVWVGTEVRNPETQRMGFVQPTEGYFNFRWLRAVAGEKVQGAWFDHIESTAQNFLDQAYQSVLAGAGELTLFHLGDLMEGHPGDALLAAALPELFALAGKVRARAPRGVAFYKPPASDSDENMYLMDYLGMLGLPLVPEARYPHQARAAVLAVQAAADPNLVDHVRRHLGGGATLILTPALLRRVPALAEMAGVIVSREAQPGTITEARLGGRRVALATPLEVDLGLAAPAANMVIATSAPPLLTRRGRVFVWNLRTFSEQDYRDTGEWLLAPKPRGLPALPDELVNALRAPLLAPLGIRLAAPARVAFYQFGGLECLYNFRGQPVEVRLNGKLVKIGANRLWCSEPL